MSVVVATAGKPAVVTPTEGAAEGDGDVVVVVDDMIAAELADTKLVEPTALPALGRRL